MTRMTLTSIQRLGAFVEERRRTAAARRQHDAILADPRMASEHAAGAAWAETNGQGTCPYCR